MRSVTRLVVTLVALALSIVAQGAGPRAQMSRVSFATPTSIELGPGHPLGHVAADFNQDGHLDLIVTPYVSVLTGNGAGSLVQTAQFGFFNASAIAAGDFTGDGALDVAITQSADKGFGYGDLLCGSLPSVGIFVQPGMAFRPPCLFAGYGPVAVQTDDFNSDGKPDLAVVSRQAQGLRIFSGRGDGTFEPIVANGPNGVVPGSLVSAVSLAPAVDLTGDGRLDLVVAHNGGLRTFAGNGDGTFVLRDSIDSTPMRGVAVGDVNSDGVPEMVSIDAPLDPVTRLPAPGRLLLHTRAADGTFATQVVSSIGFTLTDIAVADLDADGHQDIIVAHAGGGTIRMFFGNGDGTFAADPPLALSVKPKFISVRDWDEDGDLDIVILDSAASGQNALAWIALQSGSLEPDTTPPSVSLIAPENGTMVTGIVAVKANASDNVAVTRVEFYAGADLIAQSAGPDFAIAWDTTGWPDGQVTLLARAFDAEQNQAQSESVDVIVSHTAPPTDTVDIKWRNLVGVTASGSALTKTTTAGWNAGAISMQALVSGDGFIEFGTNETTTHKMLGLGHGNTNTDFWDLDFGILLAFNGTYYVFESGVFRGVFGAYLAGDQFRIAVDSGVVTYLRNGAVFYASSASPTYPLLVDTALYSPGATISDVVLAGNLGEAVMWTATASVSASSGVLTKTGAIGWNAGAISTRAMALGDGFVSFSTNETTTHKMSGLSRGNTSSDFSDIDFAILLAANGTYYVFESGTFRGVFGAYAAGDRFQVTVQGGVVKYLKNGAVFYTSGVAPAYPLLIDTSLFTPSATLTDVVLSCISAVCQ